MSSSRVHLSAFLSIVFSHFALLVTDLSFTASKDVEPVQVFTSNVNNGIREDRPTSARNEQSNDGATINAYLYGLRNRERSMVRGSYALEMYASGSSSSSSSVNDL